MSAITLLLVLNYEVISICCLFISPVASSIKSIRCLLVLMSAGTDMLYYCSCLMFDLSFKIVLSLSSASLDGDMLLARPFCDINNVIFMEPDNHKLFDIPSDQFTILGDFKLYSSSGKCDGPCRLVHRDGDTIVGFFKDG